ncbi:ATP-binding protein [Kutzneria sp. NPDC051319]|uniref:ATP-binding protein n=1 Tax=Kutzneria sp. NPDC051319 TaxID=3155047 RepID=UPI003438F1B8
MRKKILQAILLAVAVTGLALGGPLVYTTVLLVEGNARAQVQENAARVADLLDEQWAKSRAFDLKAIEIAVQKQAYVQLTGPDGKVSTLRSPISGGQISASSSIVPAGTVELSISDSDMRSTQLSEGGLVLLLLVLSVSIGTVVATLTARRLAEPLQHVAERATRLGAGDFRPDARRHGVQELDALAEALDTSAAALAQLVTRERELVGDVSHQLRSRLTALQLRLEALAMHPDQETAAEAGAALEQADRLAEVLDELLAAARAARALGAEPLDLATELPTIVEEWRQRLRADGRFLRMKVPDTLVVRATPARLREAIGVLLDNALQHGGGTVTLTARTGEGTAVIEVTDNGSGVPDELASHIFERGVSGHGSTGVGLALARALVDADGGRMQLATPRPATFLIFLPVPKPDDVLAGVGWRADPGPR